MLTIVQGLLSFYFDQEVQLLSIVKGGLSRKYGDFLLVTRPSVNREGEKWIAGKQYFQAAIKVEVKAFLILSFHLFCNLPTLLFDARGLRLITLLSVISESSLAT